MMLAYRSSIALRDRIWSVFAEEAAAAEVPDDGINPILG